MAEKLAAGGRVADVGCGHGASTVLLAQSYPKSAIVGSDSQAGEAAIREVTSQAGFSRFRRAAETPFNAVYEVRP